MKLVNKETLKVEVQNKIKVWEGLAEHYKDRQISEPHNKEIVARIRERTEGLNVWKQVLVMLDEHTIT